MKINDIFKIEHSNDIDLTPLKDLKNANYENLIKEYDLDINNFYVVEGKFYPFCYSKGTVLIEIYEMSKNYFDMFHVKKVIEQRTKIHEKCIENKNYSHLLTLIDKPFRFSFYESLFNKIPDNQKYEIFKSIYTSSEYGFKGLTREFLDKVFKYKPKTKKWFDKDVVTIYRGEGSLSSYYQDAYSWTTNLETAKYFATRFDDVGDIFKGKVKQSDILDYITDRNENEILIYPEKVFDVELIKK